MRGIESVIIVSLQWGFLHPQNWEWEPSGRRGGQKDRHQVSILLGLQFPLFLSLAQTRESGDRSEKGYGSRVTVAFIS